MIKSAVELPEAASLSRSRAAEIVQACSRFESHIMLEMDKRVVNAKSVLGLLSLNAEPRRQATLLVEGPDEEEAAACIAALFQRLMA